jgi:hypothetical protein
MHGTTVKKLNPCGTPQTLQQIHNTERFHLPYLAYHGGTVHE